MNRHEHLEPVVRPSLYEMLIVTYGCPIRNVREEALEVLRSILPRVTFAHSLEGPGLQRKTEEAKATSGMKLASSMSATEMALRQISQFLGLLQKNVYVL